MRAADGRHPLATWPAAVADAIDPALAAAAEAVAAEARRSLGTAGARADAIVTGLAEAGHVSVRVTTPDAVAREYGSSRSSARPFLRPAVAAAWPAIRQGMVDALRHAVSRRGAR